MGFGMDGLPFAAQAGTNGIVWQEGANGGDASRSQRSAATAAGTGNRLLAALGPLERRRLDGLLAPVDLSPGQVLLAPGSPIDVVHFPVAGTVVSLQTALPGGAEVGLVGAEGLVGLSVLLGGEAASAGAVALVGGRALRMPADLLRARANASLVVRDLLQRYAAARLAETAQRVACATAHPLPRRAASWLLAMRDRAGPGFPATQERVAEALGARRPTVNAVLREMRAAGLVRLARGRVALSDPAGLAAAACPCHAAARRAYECLLPLSFTGQAAGGPGAGGGRARA
jgi:CRP-like cAMP-binding protein